MTAFEDIKQIYDEDDTWAKAVRQYIKEEGYIYPSSCPPELAEFKIEGVSIFNGDYDEGTFERFWIFKIDGILCGFEGTWDSWEGGQMDKELHEYEVRQVTTDEFIRKD